MNWISSGSSAPATASQYCLNATVTAGGDLLREGRMLHASFDLGSRSLSLWR